MTESSQWSTYQYTNNEMSGRLCLSAFHYKRIQFIAGREVLPALSVLHCS